ncbi:uncharacterized protein LOC115794343 isoform X4 [Archocentrus centrarchus]|uniref:uncharacterized protein LOC115794343 isoform X4 n=1 Tax=Archocentrus centrarchus TaxID=63155 RepID=UPI0011EA509F|nr:uncharacterized protein LOC115794343 isoform X4 [Archocentrus centrarchus]
MSAGPFPLLFSLCDSSSAEIVRVPVTAPAGSPSPVNTLMPSLRMETGRQSAVDHSLVTDLMNGGQICFSCEQIFANRRFLEEHMCSSASFICSCGTEFTEYKHMQEHSTTHEPGHQVLDHETIRKRRIEKRIEEEEKLKRLRKGEVIWNTPKAAAVWTKGNMPSDSLELKPVLQVPTASVSRVQFPVQSPKISQVRQSTGVYGPARARQQAAIQKDGKPSSRSGEWREEIWHTTFC